MSGSAPPVVLENSTFLDAFGNQQATSAQFAALAGNNPTCVISTLSSLYSEPNASTADMVPVTPGFAGTITVALVLKRAKDATADSLLSDSWANRQKALGDQTKIWDRYGADQATYDQTASAVDAYVQPANPLDLSPGELADQAGYLSTSQDRTIWLTLDSAQFSALFSTDLYTVQLTKDKSFPAWGGNLSLPADIAANVGGVWVEEKSSIANPAVQDATPVSPDVLEGGNLGQGNGFAPTKDDPRPAATPNVVAATYNFPVNPATPDIALVEVNFPDAKQSKVVDDYNKYRETALGLTTPAQLVLEPSPSGAAMSGEDWSNPELYLDMSVVAGAAPDSTVRIYQYQTNPDPDGATAFLSGTPFNAYQQAFFDPDGAAPVLSSSASLASQPTPDSPFQWAWQQLFVDGMLSNVSVHLSAGDQGSSGDIPNGIANVPNSQSSPIALAVGGTSIADRYTARHADPTLETIATEVGTDSGMDLTVLWPLVAAGLTTFPTKLPDEPSANPLDSGLIQKLVEAVWQRNQVVPGIPPVFDTDFGENVTGVGGVANGVPIPAYQSDYGLDSVTNGYRGSPDVSALAGGDYWYEILNTAYDKDSTDPKKSLTTGDGGTSAAAPLWAGLTAQFDAAFQSQGLPYLGFYNDLLYRAAVVLPASFNDIQIGSNTNSFYLNGQTPTAFYNTGVNQYMTPTGQGSNAVPGYDLASGLGTPNGASLLQALEAIAHAEMSFPDAPQLLAAGSPGTWTSAVDQSLLFQPMFYDQSLAKKTAVDITLEGDTTHFRSAASDAFAWTGRFAGQTLQSDFDSELVAAFDDQAQARPLQFRVSQGDSIDVALRGVDGQPLQEALSNPYGFADFFVGDGVGPDFIRVARPLAIAETGTNDRHQPQTAIVRLSQGGQDDYSLMLYKVDDLLGSIDGLQPGEHGYAKAAKHRAYELSGPDTSQASPRAPTTVSGPGYGNTSDSTTFQVTPGDYVAMMFTDNTTHKTFSSFTAVDESTNGQGRANLWNYGLNMWGWEDFKPGTSRDYNDLVVQLDFTSAYVTPSH